MKIKPQSFFLCVLAIIFISVPILTAAGSHSSVSFYEQRSLASFPELTLDAVLDGSFFTEIDSFLSDHFCERDKILKSDTYLNLLLKKPNVNGLVVNSDVLVDFYDYSYWDLSYLESDSAEIAKRYSNIKALIESYGGYFCYLGLPLQSTYFSDKYPEYLDNRLWHTTAIRESFEKAMDSESVPFINMYEVYSQLEFPQEYYFTTDHHFSLRGAFVAYSTLLNHLNLNTKWSFVDYDVSDFEFQTLGNPFLGSSNRKLYGLWNNSDLLEIAYPRKNISFSRVDNGTPVQANLYLLPSNSTEDVTYSVYMGGDIGETIINTDRPEFPNILIYGDSFTNPIETLLWTQANELRCVDFRYYTEKNLSDYILTYHPDIVICVRDETTYLSVVGNGITE